MFSSGLVQVLLVPFGSDSTLQLWLPLLIYKRCPKSDLLVYVQSVTAPRHPSPPPRSDTPSLQNTTLSPIKRWNTPARSSDRNRLAAEPRRRHRVPNRHGWHAVGVGLYGWRPRSCAAPVGQRGQRLLRYEGAACDSVFLRAV